jgi:ribosomal protein S12 methylthiotransferase
MKVGFVSLGCSKNLVDTEKTIELFKKHGYDIVSKPEEADIIVINTCGFIESAKEEAINTILEMADYKKENCKYIIAMGCLVQRYRDELEKSLPEVDLFIKYDEYNTIWSQIDSLINKDRVNNKEEVQFNSLRERVITTGDNYAYLKIADGCDNRCTFCAIPSIRGKFESRPMEDIIEEAKDLAKKGYKEIILIAQDTTKYGLDIYGKPRLADLLKKLCKIDGIKWIRFLYAYPETIDDKLIKVVKKNDKICKYFDIPIQHISDTVLKRMNRRSNSESIEVLIKKLRDKIPGVIIRTTIMVGFPGETQEDFDKLCTFVENTKFDRLGAFAYSKEEGTPASRLKEQVHPMTKKARYNKIMEIQQKVSKENLNKYIGKEVEVLVEEKTRDGKYYVCRSYMDVPDIDGVIYLKASKELRSGDFVKCKIQSSINEYDLLGE